jgi:uncharacterized cofD-like protein
LNPSDSFALGNNEMKIVAMGGGTGLSSLLHGLKEYVLEDGVAGSRPALGDNGARRLAPAVSQLTAVVTVSDDGGSSGRLRREFRVLPPGDIRNCLVALSEDEALLSRLFQFRFSSGKGLKGHSFGNLFLTALTGVMGDFQDAVRASGEVLATRGRIFPSTNSDVHLEAVMENGRIVRGETRVSRSKTPIERLRLSPPNCRPLPETLQAMAEADAITLGPGSLFTSLIPNLLVRGVAKQMARSRAARIYICNLMTQPGETTNYSAADHLRAIYDHCGFPVFDYVLLNTKKVSPAVQRRYLAQHSRPVECDVQALESLGVAVVTGHLLSEARRNPSAPRWIRHHSGRLARAVLEITSRHRRKNPAAIRDGEPQPK